MRETNSIECNGTIYVVQQGDTMYKIAKKFRIDLNLLMQNNPYLNVFNLKPGDEMCLPLKKVPTIENIQPYVVKSQQRIVDILEENHISFQELAKYNKVINELRLPTGTILLIPNKNSRNSSGDNTRNNTRTQ